MPAAWRSHRSLVGGSRAIQKLSVCLYNRLDGQMIYSRPSRLTTNRRVTRRSSLKLARRYFVYAGTTIPALVQSPPFDSEEYWRIGRQLT